MRIRQASWVLAAMSLLASPLLAEDINPLENTFHLSCPDCVSDGKILVTGSILPSWSIRRSPPQNSHLTNSDLFLAVFVPGVDDLEFTVEYQASTLAASLFSSIPWDSSQDLAHYLTGEARAGGPDAPLSSFDVFSAGSFYVYTAGMGGIPIPFDFRDPPVGPFSISGLDGGLPKGSVIYAYSLDRTTGKITDGTAPSSSIVVVPVPEPAVLLLMAVGLVAVCLACCFWR